MTGFLLTAKQKLMLCINKRLYRPDRPCGSRWCHGTDRSDGRYRCSRNSRTGQLPFRLFDAGPDRNERDDADL